MGNIIAVSTNMSNVVAVGSNIDNVNAVAANETNININATNIDSINTTATNIDAIIDAYKNAKIAEAEAMTADSYAMEAEDVEVKEYYYDEATDSILYNSIPNTYSSLHWSIKAAYAASGLTYRGTWDSVDCSMPADDTVNGAFYIVKSVTGDTTTCPDLTAGDWLIWSEADDGGPDSWHIINWTFDWSAITNVPDNVVNAITQVELDAGLALKADITYVDNELALKADITYVDTELATKEDSLGLGTAGQLLATNSTADGKEWIDQYDGSDKVSLDGSTPMTGALQTNTLTSLSGNSVQVDDIANGNVGIGVGQTWQDMTSERALATQYVNDTGRPIMVFVSLGGTNLNEAFWGRVVLDGLSEVRFGGGYSTGGSGGTFIVPANSTYTVHATNATLHLWTELR